ncbi:MAG: hypothetical protein GPJ54_03905 [Candidatus Heimdallarchaeota archaeon]|nr:hypothetical protein [Candidatus Heimdallarchaeota archaeon]
MESLKENLSTQFGALKVKLRRVQPVEFGIAFIIFILGMILSYREFNDDGNNLYYLWLLIFVGVVLGSYIWIKAINRFFGSFTFYIVEHKWVRKIIAGGSFSYYEYQDPAKQKKSSLFLDPISQVITLLLAFVGMSVFFMGILGPDAADNPLIWGALAILVPLIATPLIPVYWALASTKVKAYANGNNTTWMVGKKYKNRFNSIITIGAIFSNLRDSDTGDLVDQIKVFLEVVKVGILILLIPTSIFIIIYYGWFKEELSGKLRESLSLKTYEIVLKEHDAPESDDNGEGAATTEEVVETDEEESEVDSFEEDLEEIEIPEEEEELGEDAETETESVEETENVEEEEIENEPDSEADEELEEEETELPEDE